MVDVVSAPSKPESTSRRIRRRRGLPGSRAVVGALFVVLAAVGTFAAHLASTAAPTTGFLVATRHVAEGEVLTDADVDVVWVTLAPAQASSVLRASQRPDVVGTVASVPIAAGAFLLGSILEPTDKLDGELFSFSLPDERALAGTVAAPVRVDLVATYGTGADAQTVYLVRGVEVISASSSAASLGGGTTLLTVRLPDPASVQRVAHALGNAQVWLVRSGSGTQLPEPYVFTGR